MNRRIALFTFALSTVAALAACSSGEIAPANEAPAVAATGTGAQPTTVVPEAEATSTSAPAEPADLTLNLNGFEDGGAIPDRYTCIGANDSPGMSWSGVPAAAQSLVLIVFDADAGADLGAGNDLGFLHWMAYDLSPMSAGLPLAATGDAELMAGGVETANDFSEAVGATFPGGALIRGTGYDGPCPPAKHTYVFRLLAIDNPLGLPAGTPYPSVLSALEGHILAIADWTGVYPP